MQFPKDSFVIAIIYPPNRTPRGSNYFYIFNLPTSSRSHSQLGVPPPPPFAEHSSSASRIFREKPASPAGSRTPRTAVPSSYYGTSLNRHFFIPSIFLSYMMTSLEGQALLVTSRSSRSTSSLRSCRLLCYYLVQTSSSSPPKSSPAPAPSLST